MSEYIRRQPLRVTDVPLSIPRDEDDADVFLSRVWETALALSLERERANMLALMCVMLWLTGSATTLYFMWRLA